jgi:hypothetical protein
VVRRGSGVLSPTTHAHPLLSSTLLFLDDTKNAHNTTSMGGHPAWDSNPADLAVVSEECRSSSHHPTVSPCYTYTHIHGPAEVPSFEKILPLRWDSNPLAPGPRPRSTVSDSHAATELDLNEGYPFCGPILIPPVILCRWKGAKKSIFDDNTFRVVRKVKISQTNFIAY